MYHIEAIDLYFFACFFHLVVKAMTKNFHFMLKCTINHIFSQPDVFVYCQLSYYYTSAYKQIIKSDTKICTKFEAFNRQLFELLTHLQ